MNYYFTYLYLRDDYAVEACADCEILLQKNGPFLKHCLNTMLP